MVNVTYLSALLPVYCSVLTRSAEPALPLIDPTIVSVKALTPLMLWEPVRPTYLPSDSVSV